MKSHDRQKISDRVLNLLAAIVGFVWILGGLAFVVSSFAADDNRVLYLGIGLCVLVAGVMLLVKRATPADVERMRRFLKK